MIMWLSFIPSGLSGELRKEGSGLARFLVLSLDLFLCLFYPSCFEKCFFLLIFFLLISSSDQQMFFHASS